MKIEENIPGNFVEDIKKLLKILIGGICKHCKLRADCVLWLLNGMERQMF